MVKMFIPYRGNINSNTSIGTNELIKQGAKLVTSQRDILDDFSWNLTLNVI